jgi:hypothetical protein
VCVLASVAALFVVLRAAGQYAVNRQVGQPIYGGGSASAGGSIRYGYVNPSVPRTSTMLPSETRNAYYRSGALPSEIRYNYARIGPLAPGGAAAYIPGGGAVVIRGGEAPMGNQVNPSAPRSDAAYAATSGWGSPAGSIHYSNLPRSTSPSVGTTAWSSPLGNSLYTGAAAPSASVQSFQPSPNSLGSVRYSSPTGSFSPMPVTR